MSPKTRRRGALFAFVMAVLALHTGTLRPGHTWWGVDDLTAYLMHGVNLLEGHDYTDLHTVRDPDLPPPFERSAFPPAHALLVAGVDRFAARNDGAPPRTVTHADVPPVPAPQQPPSPAERGRYSWRDGGERPYGFDLLGIKRLLALAFALSLPLLWVLARRITDEATAMCALMAVGLSPVFFAFREATFSEPIFLVLIMAWFVVVGDLSSETWGRALLGGLLLWAVVATRSAGLVLVPTLVVHELMQHRRVRLVAWAVLGVAAVGVLLQRGVLPAAESGYAHKAVVQFHAGTILENLANFRWNLERLWWNGIDTTFQAIVFVITTLLAMVGFFTRRQRTIHDVFVVIYMVAVLLLPTESAWLRYLLPVLPLLILDAFIGARLVGRWIGTVTVGRMLGRRLARLLIGPRTPGHLAGGRGPTLAVATLTILMTVTYSGAYGSMNYGPLTDGIATAQTRRMVDWVEQNTEPRDVIVFGKPRFMHLVTGRPALVYPQRFMYGDLPDEELWRHLEAVGARWLVLRTEPGHQVGPYNVRTYSDAAFAAFVERFPEHLVRVHRDLAFTVFELRSNPLRAGSS